MNTQLDELSYQEMVAINGGFGDPNSPAGKAGAWCHNAWINFKNACIEAWEDFNDFLDGLAEDYAERVAQAGVSAAD